MHVCSLAFSVDAEEDNAIFQRRKVFKYLMYTYFPKALKKLKQYHARLGD